MAQSNASAQGGPLALLGSSIGLKAIMAVTGLALVGFVVQHLLGNLILFQGPEAYNAYSKGLKDLGGLLWVARGGLLVMALAHVGAAAKLSAGNLAARERRYAVDHHEESTYAGRTMRWSGPIVLAFLLYHLMHLTFGVTPGEFEHSATDVYSNVVQGFSVPIVAYSYAFANILLGMHLFHGVHSMFQSLGINHPSYNPHFKVLAVLIAGFVTAGNVFIPLAVLSGAVA